MNNHRPHHLPLLLVSLFLPLCVLQGGDALQINERFRLADQEYRRALAGEVDWEPVLAYYRYLAANSEDSRHQERAYLGLAECLIAMGELWRASFALDQAIALNQNRRDWALYRMGMLRMIQAREAPDRANSRKERRRAVETYQKLADELPDSPLAPQALFFVANNELIHFRNRHRAERTYRELIERYPNSDVAYQAAQVLPTVHRLSNKQLDEMSR